MKLHIDIDCFFASAHRIDNPKLLNIPIAVGGRSNLNIFDRKNQKRKLSSIDGAFTSSILSSNDGISSDAYFKDPDGRLFSEQFFKQELQNLFTKIDIHPSHAIIQLSITISNFQENRYTTLDLFSYEDDKKKAKLTHSMQKLRDKFGVDIIKSGGEL